VNNFTCNCSRCPHIRASFDVQMYTTDTHTHTYTHTSKCAHARAHTCKLVDTQYIYTQIHTRRYTHTHKHTHRQTAHGSALFAGTACQLSLSALAVRSYLSHVSSIDMYNYAGCQ
jgi:Tfp pilus assembly protein PilW